MSTIETELADPAALDRYRELLGPGVQLLGVSPSVAGRVARLLGVAPDRLGVLPNPIEAAAFPLADPAMRDRGELLWVGSIGEHKGIDVLLRAFVFLRGRRPDLRLRLIGSERVEGDRARLEALATDLGVGAWVSFDGWLTRPDVAAAMARAGAFVHPSPSETFGVAAAEAILTGLPVAARPSGGVPWIIERSGGFGRVADDDDPESFARAIEAALDGPFPVRPDEARMRLIEAVGAAAVARLAIGLYEAALARKGVRTGTPPESTPLAVAGQPAAAPLPKVLIATERVQSPSLVASLPAALQGHLVLIVPAATGADTTPLARLVGDVRIAEADPFHPGPPRPRGRNPIARLRRALWKPAPTTDELLGRVVHAEARRAGHGGDPVDVIAIDAPAAALIAGLDPERVRLAPGSLRWLADRWATQVGIAASLPDGS